MSVEEMSKVGLSENMPNTKLVFVDRESYTFNDFLEQISNEYPEVVSIVLLYKDTEENRYLYKLDSSRLDEEGYMDRHPIYYNCNNISLDGFNFSMLIESYLTENKISDKEIYFMIDNDEVSDYIESDGYLDINLV